LRFENEKCYGWKRANDQLTAAICTNMTGTEKLLLLVIGKLKNLRCFKDVKSLPIYYNANNRAWMTAELFHEWIISFDKLMKKKKRKVCLLTIAQHMATLEICWQQQLLFCM